MPTAFKPLISIFVPTGNRAASLRRVFESLSHQTYTNFEVIVVDYKSKDNTFKYIAQFESQFKIKVINQTQKGLAKAANLALNQAEGEIFIRTDDDVFLSSTWLEVIVDTFTDPKVGGVTGPTVVPDTLAGNRDLFAYENKLRSGSWWWRLVGNFYFGFIMEGQPRRVSHWFKSGAFGVGTNFKDSVREPLQEVNNLEACNWSVRTDLLKKIKGFDKSFLGVAEYHEADAAFKIKELGYKLVFNPKTILLHLPSQDGFFNDRPASYHRMINFIVFYLRHIKLNSADKLLRFASYILFQDLYYTYQFLIFRKIKLLGAWPASIMGFIKYYQSRNYEN